MAQENNSERSFVIATWGIAWVRSEVPSSGRRPRSTAVADAVVRRLTGSIVRSSSGRLVTGAIFTEGATMTRRVIALSACALATAAIVLAQGARPASPAGRAAAQVGGKYEKQAGIVDPVYTGGKWIEITSGRPIKRGRDLWGGGATYGKMLSLGAPVWRAGADVSTRLKNEVPLVVSGRTIAPGEYSLFIDLKDPKSWTLIVSSWPAQT